MDESNPWSISSKQFSHYYAFYHELVPDGCLLGGSRAREFFLLSNIPTQVLHQIWNISDYDEDGQLNEAEFAVALHLAQLSLQYDITIPSILPEELRLVLEQATRPQLPMAKPTQLLKCSSAFLHFCENLGNRGFLKGDAAKYLLLNSHVSPGHLFHIWKLADADRDGRLSFEEFVVAMHLIFVVKLGLILPLSISTSAIFPQEFSELVENVDKDVVKLPVVHSPPPVPLVPPFVILQDRDNPFISPVFRAIPPDHFRTGKFDGFIDNPFQLANHHVRVGDGQVGHGRLASSSLEELSTANSSCSSSQNSHLDGHNTHKQSCSSHHSSVRSLVEEHTEPMLHQPESIELVRPPPPPPPPPQEDEEEEEEADPEKVMKELDQISETSHHLLTSMGGPLPRKRQEKPEPFARDANMKQAAIHGLGEAIKLVSPEPTSNGVGREKPKEPKPNFPSSKHDDILAQLDNLEAEMMMVMNDTNSFKPVHAKSHSVPVPERPPPVPKKTTPTHVKPKDEVDYPPLQRHHSASSVGPHGQQRKTSKEENGRKPDSPSRSSSSSSASSPSHRGSLTIASPRRKRSDSSVKRKSLALGDLDSLLGDELASINSMVEEFHTHDKEAQQRKKKEEQELQEMESKAKEGAKLHIPEVTSIEDIKRKRIQESAQKQKEWEAELRAIEQQASKQYNQKMAEKMQWLNDESVQSLEHEWQELLEHEKEAMKEAHVIRAQKEKEERERLERLAKEMSEKKEVTIEEWIAMMEEKKIQQMTPEQKERYEQRKEEWLQRRREKEEQRKREEEEKIMRSRARMIAEYRSVKKMEEEVKGARQSALRDVQRKKSLEHLKKEAEGRKARSEESRKKREDEVKREIEEARSKAKSAIAARFEEQVKSRGTKGSNNNDSTVIDLTHVSKSSIESREEERLARRLGNLS